MFYPNLAVFSSCNLFVRKYVEIQATTGVSQYTAGKTKEAISGGSTSMTTGLKHKGVSNMINGTKKILGMRVKKKQSLIPLYNKLTSF